MFRHPSLDLQRVAASLGRRCPDESLTVRAERRLLGVRLVEGLSVTDEWTDLFEPVRRRWLWSQRWRELRSVDEAAASVDRFFRRRPDLD